MRTKHDFVRRYAKGEFGNASPTWDNYDSWLRSIQQQESERPPEGLYHVRNRVAGARTWYNVGPWDLETVWREASGLYSADNLYISAMAPTERTILQGEVQQSKDHLDLRWSRVVAPMRDALRQCEHSSGGLLAVSLLRTYLCPNSYDWLQFILDAYPDHVIEFSTYSINWGTLPHFNTIFWEVRLY